MRSEQGMSEVLHHQGAQRVISVREHIPATMMDASAILPELPMPLKARPRRMCQYWLPIDLSQKWVSIYKALVYGLHIRSRNSVLHNEAPKTENQPAENQALFSTIYVAHFPVLYSTCQYSCSSSSQNMVLSVWNGIPEVGWQTGPMYKSSTAMLLTREHQIQMRCAGSLQSPLKKRHWT